MTIKTVVVPKKEVENVDTVERTRSGKAFLPPVDIIEKEAIIVLSA